MPVFTMEQLRALSVGQGESPETFQDVDRSETPRLPPLAQANIRQKIYDVLIQNDDWMSRAAIANGIGRKKAAWIGRHLDQMVRDGYLDSYDARPAGALLPSYYYRVRR